MIEPTRIYCHGELVEVRVTLPSSFKRGTRAAPHLYDNVYTCTGCGVKLPWLIRAPILLKEEKCPTRS